MILIRPPVPLDLFSASPWKQGRNSETTFCESVHRGATVSDTTANGAGCRAGGHFSLYQHLVSNRASGLCEITYIEREMEKLPELHSIREGHFFKEKIEELRMLIWGNAPYWDSKAQWYTIIHIGGPPAPPLDEGVRPELVCI